MNVKNMKNIMKEDLYLLMPEFTMKSGNCNTLPLFVPLTFIKEMRRP